MVEHAGNTCISSGFGQILQTLASGGPHAGRGLRRPSKSPPRCATATDLEANIANLSLRLPLRGARPPATFQEPSGVRNTRLRPIWKRRISCQCEFDLEFESQDQDYLMFII